MDVMSINTTIVLLIIVFVLAGAVLYVESTIADFPREPVVIEQPGDDFECEELYQEIEDDLDRANYCRSDDDCDVIMLGSIYIEFGCYHYINKDVDKRQFYQKMEAYSEKCMDMINYCMPAPDATCVDNTCVFVE
jgi:hypothetical protein